MRIRRINYGKQLKVWTSQYMNDPPPERAFQFNPTAFKLKKCEKCNKMPKRKGLERHHRGHEFMFANILPSRYAKRYIEFHPDDIAFLCKRCHKNETRYTKPIIAQCLNEYRLLGKMSYERCEFWRQKLIKTYNKWVKLSPRRKYVSTIKHTQSVPGNTHGKIVMGIDWARVKAVRPSDL